MLKDVWWQQTWSLLSARFSCDPVCLDIPGERQVRRIPLLRTEGRSSRQVTALATRPSGIVPPAGINGKILHSEPFLKLHFASFHDILSLAVDYRRSINTYRVSQSEYPGEFKPGADDWSKS